MRRARATAALRASARRSWRLPPHSKQVGAAFQPTTASSSQVIRSSWLWGCWPARARPHTMRWSDCQWPSESPRWWPRKVPTPWAAGYIGAPPGRGRERASRMRKESPSVTTVTAWWSKRSMSETAVACSGRKRPHWSKGQWLATPRLLRS